MNITLQGKRLSWSCWALLLLQTPGVLNAQRIAGLTLVDTGRSRAVAPHTLAVTANSVHGAPEAQIFNGDESMAPSETPIVTKDIRKLVASAQGTVSGELKKWHKITIAFLGPFSTETANARNPFTDFRIDVNFTHSESKNSYLVPGYFGANGNAANSRSSSGSVWIVHFCPDATGTWEYSVRFTQGQNVAQNGGGLPGPYINGASGSFVVEPTDKTGRDHRAKGRLQYVGKHHLRFAETGEYFLKGGSDSPENLLAYQDFDNTPNKKQLRKSWAPHVQDYQEGDPTWAVNKGKGLIGAINYLSNKGMNAISFLTLNIGGDDENVFPYISNRPQDRTRFDVSKLAQWEVVFEHADRMGIFLHFKTQEREIDLLLDGGELGLERKLYYRELIARFGHHLALNWNIGEENTNTVKQRKAFIDYFKKIDPYDHPVVLHTWPNKQEPRYRPLLGYNKFNGVSIQALPAKVHRETLKWVKESATAGFKWVVANDEQNPADKGVVPDAVDPSKNKIRKNVLWGNIMAGGGGVEYYFGYAYNNSDLTCQDFRSRENMWNQTRYALEFFKENSLPFWNMSNADEIVSTGKYALTDPDGSTVVIYSKVGVTLSVNLTRFSPRSYSLKWYNPREGGSLVDGSQTLVGSGSPFSIRVPSGADWVLLLRCTVCSGDPVGIGQVFMDASPGPTTFSLSLPSAAALPSQSLSRMPSPAVTSPAPPSESLSRMPTFTTSPLSVSSGSPSWMTSTPLISSEPLSRSPSQLPSFTQSDLPSDSLSDKPSDPPRDQPSDIPSPSQLPSFTQSDLPSDSPNDMPSDPPGDVSSDILSDTPSKLSSKSIGPDETPSKASNLFEDIIVAESWDVSQATMGVPLAVTAMLSSVSIIQMML